MLRNQTMLRTMNIVSIQSSVCYGHVGNDAARFPLQRLGAEVWAINTVQFSNHTGYGDWTGQVCPASLIGDLAAGLDRRGAFGQADALLSGYLGDPATGDAVLKTVHLLHSRQPRALYACDPVIGDDRPGIFVRPGVAELIATRAIPEADLLTPNHFELSHLAGYPTLTLARAKQAAANLRLRMRAGRRLVLVTSLAVEDTPQDALDLLLATDAGFHRLRTPRLDLAVNGAGDLIAALFLFHVLDTNDPIAAFANAASSTWGIIARTAPGAELALIAAQDELIQPSHRFVPHAC